MPQLLFKVTHQMINRVDTFKPVADSKNYLYAHFDFLTNEWTGSIVAIFTKNDISYKMLLDSNNECIVPWELLVGGGDIFVSCYQDYLITVNTARVTVIKSGYVEDAENSQPPTPDMYEQMLQHIDDLKEEFLIIDGGNFTDWNKEN